MSEVDRIYKLTVIRAPEIVDIVGLRRSFFEEMETITEIADHRIQFKVVKHRKKEPNTAEVTITNLSSPSRDDFKKGPTKVRIEAGYDGVLRLLFIGDLRFADSVHDGTNWLTKLQLADGGRAYAHARVNRSYGKGTPLSTVIGEVAKAFGTSLPSEVADSPELNARLSTGDVVTGYAADEMTRLLGPFGFEWSFQNGRLQITRFDQVVPGTARVISQDDGMIGSPEIDPPKIVAPPKTGHRGEAREQKVPKFKVKHTLYPELTPAEHIRVQSQKVNGDFRLDVVTHEGDSRGNEWDSEIEASAI